MKSLGVDMDDEAIQEMMNEARARPLPTAGEGVARPLGLQESPTRSPIKDYQAINMYSPSPVFRDILGGAEVVIFFQDLEDHEPL